MKKTISVLIAFSIVFALFAFSSDIYSAYNAKGDINNDDKVNAIDSNLMNLIITGTEAENLAADIDSDGKVNSVDANLLNLIITGKYEVQEQLVVDDPDIMNEIDAKSNKLLSEIYEPEEINTSGTIYYISSMNGNDSNDGKTPETAWKTISKLSKVTLSYGSTVLFERRGTYRGKIDSNEGITYSAYGNGEMPMIIGSPYDGAKEGTWSETKYPNVYKYSYKMSTDIGLITYNNSEGYIGKIAVNFTGDYENATLDTILKNKLTTDLTFYHDLGGAKIENTSRTTGYVYVYSTEGNPSERFNNIEFNTGGNIILLRSGCSVSNLHIAYGGSHGIAGNSCNDIKISHCELSWIGGSVQNYTNGKYVRFGNAVEIWGSCDGYTIDHCYIHDVYDAAMTFQFQGTLDRPIVQNNVTYSNNLIERCVYSVEYFMMFRVKVARVV